jgi:biotin carboxyl carrier protein
VVLEAMKMEQIVSAPYDATVGSVEVAPGEQVTTGTVLVTLETT